MLVHGSGTEEDGWDSGNIPDVSAPRKHPGSRLSFRAMPRYAASAARPLHNPTRGGMSVYDQAVRYAAKLDPDAFLHWLLSGVAPGWRFTGCSTPRRSRSPASRIVVATPWRGWNMPTDWPRRGRSWLNCKRGNDPALPDRLLEYLVRLWGQLRHGPHGRDRYQSGAVLVQLTVMAPSVSLDMVLPGNAGVELRLGVRGCGRWRRRTLPRSWRRSTAVEWVAALPWTPFMRGGGEATVIAEWKRLGELEANRRTRGNYRRGAGVRRTGRWSVGPADALEGWDVEESAIVANGQSRPLDGGLQQGRQQGLEQGRSRASNRASSRGRQQGLEQGRQQGQEQGMGIGREKPARGHPEGMAGAFRDPHARGGSGRCPAQRECGGTRPLAGRDPLHRFRRRGPSGRTRLHALLGLWKDGTLEQL